MDFHLLEDVLGYNGFSTPLLSIENIGKLGKIRDRSTRINAIFGRKPAKSLKRRDYETSISTKKLIRLVLTLNSN